MSKPLIEVLSRGQKLSSSEVREKCIKANDDIDLAIQSELHKMVEDGAILAYWLDGEIYFLESKLMN